MSLNKVMILGRLGADPELKYTPSQTPVCSLRLATNDRRKGQDGEWVDHTEWHRVSVFGRQAETCSQYLKKGRQAFIEGRIQTKKWQDKEGNDRYSTDIVANNVQFIGGKNDSGGGASYDSVPSGSGGLPAGVKPAKSAAPSASGGIESVPFDDDDIPF